MRNLPALVALALGVAACGTTATSPLTASEVPPGGEAAARYYLRRIALIDDDDEGPGLNSVIAVNPDAPAEAREAAASGLPLGGRAVLVKDNVETRELPTTAGSLALASNATGRDAPLIARMRTAGGVVL